LRKYITSDAVVVSYADDLRRLSTVVSDPAQVRVVRDPNDDMILACAIIL
jgi:predicted nucleic acid-binding protein